MNSQAAVCFDLAPRSARRLDSAAGRELIVLRGQVWLTCTDHSEDVFISAGRSVRLGVGAVVECNGEDGARLRLAPGERSWGTLAGQMLAALGRTLPRLPKFQPTRVEGRGLE